MKRKPYNAKDAAAVLFFLALALIASVVIQNLI
jgi:hypothetical protein